MPPDQQATLVTAETTDQSPNITRSIRHCLDTDLKYLMHLQNRWANNIGFLPRPALERYLRTRQTLIVLENDDPAGYLNWTFTRKGLVRIIQVAIEPELLRTTLGTKVMRHIERAAVRGKCSALRLSSRTNLPANQFWPQLGFQPTAIFHRPTNRGLPLIEWTKQLITPTQATLAVLNHGKGFRRTNKAAAPSVKFA